MKKKIKKYINIEKKVGKCPRIFSSYKMMVFEIYGCWLYFRIFFRSYNGETVNILFNLKGMIDMTREDEKVFILTNGIYKSLEEIKTVLDVTYRLAIKKYDDMKGINIGIPVTNVTLTEDNEIKFDFSMSATINQEAIKNGGLSEIF